MKNIYLDYSATTPLDPDILRVMFPFFDAKYGNPSSMHSSGRRAKAVIDSSRKTISKCINSLPEEIIFTGSGTEANNMAILGIARAHSDYGKHIIIGAIEHKSIMESARFLKKEGFEIDILGVDEYGLIDIEKCLNLVRKDTILISIMYANNEIGTIEPIRELSREIAKFRGSSIYPILHTDACQASGQLSIDVRDLGVDLMTLNSSKIYGPKGVGMLYKKKGLKIKPLIVGGDQENHFRAGTENIALIYGFAYALEKAERERLTESARLTQLRDYFIRELQAKLPSLRLNGHPTKRLPNNIHISIPEVEGEAMLLVLDQAGIEASTGSACSAFDLKPSHVLLAINQDEEIIHGSIRFTLGRYTTREDIDYVLSVFPSIVSRLRGLSATHIYYAKIMH